MATLTNIDVERNRYRFYSIALMPTLFGDWMLLREWGRIGSPGTVRLESFQTEDEAKAAERQLIKTRTRHGYKVNL